MLSILFIYFHHYHNSKTLGFIYFVGLKNTPEAIGLCGLMSSFGLNSPKQIRAQQSHTSKDTWLCTKNAPDSHQCCLPLKSYIDINLWVFLIYLYLQMAQMRFLWHPLSQVKYLCCYLKSPYKKTQPNVICMGSLHLIRR